MLVSEMSVEEFREALHSNQFYHMFTDAQKCAECFETFEAPTMQELENLKVGEFVKVAHSGQRFWTIIRVINGEKILAEVNNILLEPHPFKCGQAISFKKRNIYKIDR